MTIVYPLQAQKDYTELLFSLRSIEKYFTPPYEVVVVGSHIPDWLHNVIQIAVPDVPGRKQLSIKKKIIAALRFFPEIFFMNDDIFLLNHTDGSSFPFYFKGSLATYSEGGSRPLMEHLMSLKKTINNFDIHTPIMYDRRFIKVISYLMSDVIIKSGYCNFLGIGGVPYADCKVNRKLSSDQIEAMLINRSCFSTGPSGLSYAVPVLQKLFPEKSIFEV